jgi:hypothetical protein
MRSAGFAVIPVRWQSEKPPVRREERQKVDQPYRMRKALE